LRAEIVAADSADPKNWWDGTPFDRILLDAPCSGLGVIRRHPDIRLRKSPSDIDKLPELQGRLLRSTWDMLAPGGRLVYVTCTLTRSEKPRCRCRVFGENSGRCDCSGRGLARLARFGEADEIGRQILPGEAGADGFYYAALTKA